MEKALAYDSPESRELCEKLVTMLTAKGNGARIHVLHAGGVAYVDEDIPAHEQPNRFDERRGYGSVCA